MMVVIIILVIILQLGEVQCKRCRKNDVIGWREGNIYECNDINYPICCERNRQFTCCEETHVKNLREQLQLWGTVFVFLLALTMVFAYFKVDSASNLGCCAGSSRTRFYKDTDIENGSIKCIKQQSNTYEY